mmetsp:Transcript_58396/g.142813  ORF Transcript_58396/g.142813 Transcript_58396/m.142813 type:complete len:200 (-) Transcript_58396:1180-1779(-)
MLMSLLHERYLQQEQEQQPSAHFDSSRRGRLCSCSCDSSIIMDNTSDDDERLMMLQTNMTSMRQKQKQKQKQNYSTTRLSAMTVVGRTSFALSTILAVGLAVVAIVGPTTSPGFVAHGFQPSAFMASSSSSSLSMIRRQRRSGSHLEMMFGRFNNKSKNIVVPAVENKDYIRKNGLIRGHVKRTYPIRFNHKKSTTWVY